MTGFADSPIGLATFLLDHDARSLELIARSFDGQTEGLTPDDVLDNVTLFLANQHRVSSARLYWENKLAFFTPKGVKVPTAVSVFPDELYQTPRNWAERAYPKLIHYNKVAKGGHFAPGNSRYSFQKRFARASDHCASSGGGCSEPADMCLRAFLPRRRGDIWAESRARRRCSRRSRTCHLSGHDHPIH